MRRRTGNHAVSRCLCQNGHLSAEQHARVDTAHLRKAQESAFEHICNHKTNLIEMRIEQDRFCIRLAAALPAQHAAARVKFYAVAVRSQQLCRLLCSMSFKSGHTVCAAQLYQHILHNVFLLVIVSRVYYTPLLHASSIDKRIAKPIQI